MTSFFLDSDIKEIVKKFGLVKDLSNKTIVLTGGRGLGDILLKYSILSCNVLDKPIKVIVLDNLIASGNEG